MSIKKGVRNMLRLEQVAQVLAELELSHWLALLELKGPFRMRSAEAFDTQPKTVRAVLERLGGAFLKLGQILALRPDLVGVVYSKEFEKLLEDVPAESWEDIAAVIQKHVPGGLSAFASINHQPIASGSVAQVHRAVLRNGHVVAVKVKRPGVDERFASDIGLMRMFAKRYVAKHGTAVFDALAIVDEFESYTNRELALGHELRNLQRFAGNFSKQKAVHIPMVYPELSSDTVLVMEFIVGAGVLSLRGSKDRTRKRAIVHTIVDAAYQQLFIDGFFHADLHAGNIFVTPGQKIALLDCGIVGFVDQQLKRKLLELFQALTAGNLEATVQALAALNVGEGEPDLHTLHEGIYFSMGEYYGKALGKIPIGRVLLECIETARRAKLKLPAQLVLFTKSLVTLEGVCAAIDPSFDIVASAKPFLRSLERQLFTPRKIAERGKALAVLATRALGQLPEGMSRIDRHLRTLDSRITDIDDTFRFLAHAILRVSKLLAATLLLAAVLITAALLIRTEPQWHGISVYTLVGAGIALLLLFLIIELMRRKP